jgi:hypothetical protein
MVFFALVTALAVLPIPARAQAVTCAGHLVTLAPDGSVVSGSKAALRDAVASGAPIRISWSLDPDGNERPDLTHWAEATFVSEWQGEIFAQIADIQRQAPRREPTRIDMTPGRQRWSGLIGTTGVLSGHFDDGSDPTETRVRTTWCLAGCSPPSWRLMYHHDADGTPIAGSKARLFEAVRRGEPVRLAWGASITGPDGTASVEHAADPVFLTIMNGSELFVQLPEHIAQASYVEPGKATFDSPGVMWRGLMGTNGSFDAAWVDRATGREVRRLPQRARLAWFALGPPEPACTGTPLTLAVPGGVRRAP